MSLMPRGVAMGVAAIRRIHAHQPTSQTNYQRVSNGHHTGLAQYQRFAGTLRPQLSSVRSARQSIDGTVGG
jgi:hypothetical protein